VLALSYLGAYGGINAISSPTDMVLLIIVTLVCYYWGVASGHQKLVIPQDEDEPEDQLTQVKTTSAYP
jgi:hypothetical protein